MKKKNQVSKEEYVFLKKRYEEIITTLEGNLLYTDQHSIYDILEYQKKERELRNKLLNAEVL